MMKKSISYVIVIVALAVLTTVTVFATDYTDLNGTAYQNYVQELSKRGIVSGYPDGQFKPENNITRAEFAAIVTKMRGVSELSAYTSDFKDMAGYGWANGYIGYCAANKIMQGDGNGNAMPSKNISYGEAVTMLVRASGFEKEVESIGYAWPQNYINVAEKHDLLKNLEKPATTSEVLTRGDVAVITYNTITVNSTTNINNTTNVTNNNNITINNTTEKEKNDQAENTTNNDKTDSTTNNKTDSTTNDKTNSETSTKPATDNTVKNKGFVVFNDVLHDTNDSGALCWQCVGYLDGKKMDTLTSNENTLSKKSSPTADGRNWELYEVGLNAQGIIVTASKVAPDTTFKVETVDSRTSIAGGNSTCTLASNVVVYEVTDNEYRLYAGSLKVGDSVQVYDIGGSKGYDVLIFSRP